MNAEDLSLRIGAFMVLFCGAIAVLGFPSTGRAEMPTAPTDGTTEGSVFLSYNLGDQTFQNLYLDAELLGLHPGDVITGISFRLNDSVSGFTGATFTRFDIAMGPGNDTLATTFADNFASPPTTVRSGALTIDAADFDEGESPNAFGKPLALSTPYEYTGGNLIVEIRASTGTLSLDMFNDTDGIQGTTVGETDADATTGSVLSLNLAVAFEITPGGKTPTEIAIPNGATIEGSDARNIAKLSAVNGQVWQNLYKETDLGSELIAGDQIVGYCLRLNGAETHFGSAIFSRFDVKLGRAASPFQNLTGIRGQFLGVSHGCADRADDLATSQITLASECLRRICQVHQSAHFCGRRSGRRNANPGSDK